MGVATTSYDRRGHGRVVCVSVGAVTRTATMASTDWWIVAALVVIAACAAIAVMIVIG